MSIPSDMLIGPGQSCVYCGQGYGQHLPTCLESEKKRRPRRFRWKPTTGKHPNGSDSVYCYGCYFPLTDLCVGDMGGLGTGVPKDVEWIDS